MSLKDEAPTTTVNDIFVPQPMSLDAQSFELLADQNMNGVDELITEGDGVESTVDDLVENDTCEDGFDESSEHEFVETNNTALERHGHDEEEDEDADLEPKYEIEEQEEVERPMDRDLLSSPQHETMSETTIPTSGDLRRTSSRVSSSNRPFPCNACGKRFVQKAHLIIHKRTHTGEKPYACHICHKRFAQSSHLTVHKRVHTGEKPFFCNICGMGFCRKPRLEAHVLQHVMRDGRKEPNTTHGDFQELSEANGITHEDVFRGRGRGRTRGRGRPRSFAVEVGAALAQCAEVKNEPVDQNDDEDDEMDDDEQLQNNNEGSSEIVNNVLNELATREETENYGADSVRMAGHVSRRLITKSNSPSPAASGLHQHYVDFRRRNNGGDSSLSNGEAGINSFSGRGLVRTNSRVSLIEYKAADMMQHLMSRDDVKSCDYCCMIFNDPAMYFLHRCMHDKMDVRRCNMCGKMATDKYDFMAHFLSQHK